MIGIVIPVHNEERLLGRCLDSVLTASRHEALDGERVRVVVVLDSCSDSSEAVAQNAGVEIVRIEARMVGAARAAGANILVSRGARWLSFTDADSYVAPDWLVRQLEIGANAVCGTVQIDQWDNQPESLRRIWCERYHDADGHRHVHGANLGVSVWAYERAGGFPSLTCSEDLALVDAIIAAGIPVVWSASPRVATSARTQARVGGGFGDTLARWAQEGANSGGSSLVA
ncbi:glycosyltransferase [Paraburkholderia acidisoli]|uniref:Glycosyltransferase n=1 Tax=Paraburkholderia acidisoli TaxID=2571748 RepID=A0A7Z2GSH1_9BURK|nr:glycosyltransferase family 2 protein [Paraburkholderia acidisoli]QGZ66940.1 glycosyltransferase [Paraburkholderia acidisoli]